MEKLTRCKRSFHGKQVSITSEEKSADISAIAIQNYLKSCLNQNPLIIEKK